MIRSSLETRAAIVLAFSAIVLALVADEASADSGAAVGTRSSPPANAAPAEEEASNHFKRGLRLFDEGDYALALVEFERAYELAPNYKALYDIALVDVQLGRYADAARTFEQYLHDGGQAIAPARRTEVSKTLGELRLRTATVEISTNVPAAEVTFDGKPLDPARLRAPMLIDAGEHTLQATAPGYQPALRTLTLAGSDRASARLDLVALTPQQRPASETAARDRTLFWSAVVATGTLAAAAIVSAGIMADARSHENELQNTPASDPGQRTTWANRANSAALAADILTGLAVVGGGVSIYLSLGPERPTRAPIVAISAQRASLAVPF